MQSSNKISSVKRVHFMDNMDWQSNVEGLTNVKHVSPTGRIQLELGGLLFGEEAVAFIADQQRSVTYVRYADGAKLDPVDFDWLLHVKGGVCDSLESYYTAQFVQTSKITLD